MMDRKAIAWLAAMSVLAAAPAHAQSGGDVYANDQFDALRAKAKITRPGRDPIDRAKYDSAVRKLFAVADTDRDGMVTLAEVQTIISGRAEQAIQSRFTTIDSNRDKTLSYAEFSAWQRGLGSVALSETAAAAGPAIVSPEIRADLGRGAEGELLAELIQPISSNVIVAANTNYDAGMSLPELIAYEGKRFDARDANHDGWLNDAEARDQVAATPAPPRG